MKDFAEFEKIVRNPEISNLISKKISSRTYETPVPENAPEDYADRLGSFIANISGEVALSLLQIYHQWVSNQDKY